MKPGFASRYSAHVDRFCGDNLPLPENLPDLIFTLPDLHYPERLNCVSELVDVWLARGHGDAPAVRSPTQVWSYAELARRINRIANVLTGELGLVSGNRVLLRAPNTPELAAVYLAVMKAGGVAVATMPLLRARELAVVIDKAQVALAVCDAHLIDELAKAQALTPMLSRIVTIGGEDDTDLMVRAASASPDFEACPTAAQDICLIGFTSGTTGQPKGAMHAHRDVLAVCDTYGAHVLKACADDVFVGSPPLAFTFGLGGLVLFPLRVGASTLLLEKAGPDDLLAAIDAHRPTVCFTAPTAYRAMLANLKAETAHSLRICVSAGEPLPRATFEAWEQATGVRLMDGIGATEMLHIFIGAPVDRIRPGSTGLVVPGYEARIIDEAGREVARGTPGRLAVRGPTGCRYLADTRQAAYVSGGWNITGDTYVQDIDGYFWYQARNDDMIVSSGYNIAGPEVEASLLAHPAVAECGVVGQPDPERGMVVKAYVVLAPPFSPDETLAKTLQDHVKADIAPFKYPRIVAFVDALPRTGTGKLQRFVLRDRARSEATAR